MDGVFTQLRWLFSPQDKKKILLLALLMAVSALLEMAGLGLLVAAAAFFISPETQAARQITECLSRILPGIPESGYVALTVAFIALLLIGKNIFAYVIVRMQSRFAAGKQRKLAERLFKTYLHAKSEDFSLLMPDECFSNITRVSHLCNQVLLPAVQMLADILVIFTLTVAALVLFPWITLFSSIFMFAAAAGIAVLTKKINLRTGKKFLEADLQENRLRHTGIYGKKSINITSSEEFFAGQFAQAYGRAAELFSKLYSLGQIPRLALESAAVLTAAGLFCILLISGVPKAQIMLIFAVLTAAVARMLPALSRCHYNLVLLRQFNVLLDALTSSLRNIPQEQLVPSGEAADAAGEIVFDRISFAYRNGTEVFKDFSLTLAPGSATAIAGKSGRGKTTLAELLLTLLKPQSGTITAGGVDIFNAPGAWRHQVGYVPQDIFLMESSVRENVAFGIAAGDIDDARVNAALKLARLDDFTPEMMISGSTISGGQRQRIGIARALYFEAKLLILDEPTSALDGVTEEEFCRTLEQLRGRVTMVVISHRESTLQYCDQVVTL